MDIEIVEPGPAPDDGTLPRSGNKVLIWCDCDGATSRCPQGKTGSMIRCRVWLELKHVSGEAMAASIRMNTFDR